MKKEKLDEAINLFRDSVVPATKSQKGYKDVCLLTDRNTGKSISIAFWDTEDDAVANEQSGYYQEQLDKFKDLITAPPVREGYEVSVQA
jgi:heme-degrading monooxygenase HmoA